MRTSTRLAITVLWLSTAASGAEPSREGWLPAQRLGPILEHHNRGVAWMEQFKPDRAVEEFRRVVELAPDWTAGRLNLAVALLNTQKDDDLEECHELLLAIQNDAPENPTARYSLGMLYLYRGRTEDALREFRAAHELAPRDAHTLYQLGKIAHQKREYDEAEARFRQALEILPGLSAAYYGLGRIALSRGQRDEGKRYLRRFQELERGGTGIKVDMTYASMGPLADVIRPVELPGRPSAGSAGAVGLQRIAPALRGDLSPLADTLPPGVEPDALQTALTRLPPPAALCDLDGDGIPDLFLGERSPRGGRLLLGGAAGTGRERAASDLAAGAVVTAAAAGDYDGDGDLDLVLATTEGWRVGRNRGDGTFEDVTESSKLSSPPGTLLSSVHLVDVDQDGDLDIFAAGFLQANANGSASPAPDRLYLNLGTGSFREETGALGGLEPQASLTALFSDLDGDGALDLLVGCDDAPLRLLRNGRALDFAPPTYPTGLADAGPVRDAFTADLDGNGLPEIILLRTGGAPALLARNLGQCRFELSPLSPVTPGASFSSGAAADLDLDGDLDLLFSELAPGADSAEPLVLSGDGLGGLTPRRPPVADAGETGLPPGSYLLVDDLDRDGALDVLVIAAGHAPTVLRGSVPPGHHWLRVRLRGTIQRRVTFSNRHGIGATVEVKAGDRWITSQLGVGGSSRLAVHVGLGTRAKADYIRILWPDGTLQSEMEVSGDREFTIDEVKRKSSSCPLLFAWDGDRFGFITDFLGTGGLGFYLQPGVYAPPDPTESIRIPPGALHARDGMLSLRILEPLEEVCYLDHLELLAVDHPIDTEIYPQERFGGSLAQADGRLLVVGESVLPDSVSDGSGNDVSDLLAAIDRRWPELERDARFTGFVREHEIRFELGAARGRLRGSGGPVYLFLHGWVEYTYSHVNYAAHQSGLTLSPPRLEIPDGRGAWKTVIPDTGYPAGLPRTMVLPLPDEVLDAGDFRLRSNMEIYWDHAFLAADRTEAGQVSPTVRVVPLSSAHLEYYGYPREYSPDGREPFLYDYHQKASGVFFRDIPGEYTRFGEVSDLLEGVDDRFVIFGRGDEIRLEFDGKRLPALSAGQTRTFVLRAHGYCKDRDAHTAHPDGVEPLPFQGMSGYPYAPGESYPADVQHRLYLERWNTRRVHDR